jgi:hypothetical protein
MEMIEYKILESMLYLNVEDLNDLGAQGWELIVLMDRVEPVRYIFSRRVAA